MGDDGTMTKGTRYTPEFKAKAVRLLTESRGSYSSETKAIEQVAKDLGVAPETLRRWRNKTDATVAAETKQSAEDAMAELKSLRAEVARLRRANEILTTASAFSRHGSTRHGVDGRLHRRIQGPFQGRADLQGAGRFAGLRVRHAARLPHVQIQARQPHGRQARGAGPRHPRDPCRFLHGRVRVPQDARPVVGAGLGSGRDRPRPGDERHAGIGESAACAAAGRPSPPNRRRARAAGPTSWNAGSRRRRRTGCTWPTSPTCAWPTARSATRRSSPTCSPAGSSDGRAPPPWTPGSCRCRRWNRRYHGPPRMAARTVSCTIPTMARSTSASCTPPGSGNSACFPRPARSVTRTTTPWPRAPTARTGPSSSGDASPSRI